MSTGILATLMETATGGAGELTGESRQAVAAFVRRQFNGDGGVANRAGQSDLYYTVFGLSCLRVLALPVPASTRAFVSGEGAPERLGFVHLTCLVRNASLLALDGALAPPALVPHLERFRARDGGYGLKPGAPHGTVYDAFLAMLAYEAAGKRPPRSHALARGLARLRSRDGAVANQPGLPQGTTTATAAAIAFLKAAGQPIPSALPAWLLAQALPAGGFRGSPDTPVPDLLSTAVALHALRLAGTDPVPTRSGCLDFLEALWQENGGFTGAVGDPTADCEYTFYALLALGALRP